MKVLLINTYNTFGGAAVACLRLLKAHQKNGVNAHLLVEEKTTSDKNVTAIANTFWQKKKVFLRFAFERLAFLPFERDKSVRFAFSTASIGTDISEHPLVQDADILHLHWINFGFLSLKSLRKLIALGKPIVWTLHDMWAFTGGCHYAGDCTNYQQNCGNCHFLKKPHDKDLSFQTYEKKNNILKEASVSFVTCSNWLKEMAEKSSLLEGKNIVSIPNPINTDFFTPIEKSVAQQKLGLPENKFLLLFGAMNISDSRKGFSYLEHALQILVEKNPETKNQIELVIFGKGEDKQFSHLPYPIHFLGQISNPDKLVQIYNAVNLFVLPSLEDNLPNTIMEALACGTPALAFRTGGLPQMIDHMENGYLAFYKSADSLAEGISWVMKNTVFKNLSKYARQKVLDNYSETHISNLYLQLYKQITQNQPDS